MLSIQRIAFIITTHCTLRCAHCVHLNSRYQERAVFPIADLSRDVQKLLAAVDRVESLHVMGGEALLHPDLPRLIEMLLDQPRIGYVGLTTNATRLPGQELLAALKHPRAGVYLSNYSRIDTTLEWARRLTQAGVAFHSAPDDKDWVDAGGVEARGRSLSELRQMYIQCLYRECTTLLNGRLFTCPRNANAVNQGLIPFPESGGVDLRMDSIPAIREGITRMLGATDHLACCDRCDYVRPDGVQRHIPRAT